MANRVPDSNRAKKAQKTFKKAQKLVATKPLSGPIAGGSSLGMDRPR